MARRTRPEEELFALARPEAGLDLPGSNEMLASLLEHHRPTRQEQAIGEAIAESLVELAGEALTNEVAVAFTVDAYQTTYDRLDEAIGHILAARADVFSDEHASYMTAIGRQLIKGMVQATCGMTDRTATSTAQVLKRPLRRPVGKVGVAEKLFGPRFG